MINEPLVANQERFKQLNDNQIAALHKQVVDYNGQVDSYTQAIEEAKKNIIIAQEAIVKVEASNVEIDLTIAILQQE